MMPKAKAIVLFSGGLDSLLAVRILQEQGLDVEGFTVETPFHRCEAVARPAAEKLGIPLTVRPVGSDYAAMLRKPRWGFGKAMNPCLDCRVFMCRMAKQRLDETGACLVASGEVAGQRPNSQKEHQLHLIAKSAGLQGRLLRPLSAQLLKPTIAEEQGIVARERLYRFSGRGRSRLVELSRSLGIEEAPQPSTGCLLTERSFTTRLRDLLKHTPGAPYWAFELLPVGRHLRVSPTSKAIVGRREDENRQLERFARSHDAAESAFLYPLNFNGPAVLWVGPVDGQALSTGAALVLRFAKRFDPENAIVEVVRGGVTTTMQAFSSRSVAELPIL